MHKTLQSLLLRGVDLKAKEEALVGADTESTQMLIRYGASPNANGPAPLIYAVERVDVATAQVLLSAGANPNCKNQEGYTPLMFAGEPEIAKLLIQSGANVNAKDKDGFSVLAHADGNYKRFDQEEHKGLMALLKQYGAKE